MTIKKLTLYFDGNRYMSWEVDPEPEQKLMPIPDKEIPGMTVSEWRYVEGNDGPYVREIIPVVGSPGHFIIKTWGDYKTHKIGSPMYWAEG